MVVMYNSRKKGEGDCVKGTGMKELNPNFLD